jgi:hypothetical protein
MPSLARTIISRLKEHQESPHQDNLKSFFPQRLLFPIQPVNMQCKALFFGLLASVAVASPIDAAKGLTVYSLRVSSRFSTLDGKYLSIQNGTVGVYGREAQQVKFYTVPSSKPHSSSNVELHTYPIGIVDHTLALIGQTNGGLMTMRDVMNAAAPPPAGTTVDYSSFRMANHPNVADRPAQSLTYAGPVSGGWVVFPSGPKGGQGWDLTWKSNDALTIENYQVVDLQYEVVANNAGYGGASDV